jgi:CBS domain-containing protein
MQRTIDSIIAKQDLYSIGTGMTVREAAHYMADRSIGAVSVMEDDRLVGIFSERDIMKRVVAADLDPATTLVSEVMSRELRTGSRGDTYKACIDKMHQHRCRHLPIVDGERVVGMVSLRDLLDSEVAEKSEEIEHLHAYLYSSPPMTAKGE